MQETKYNGECFQEFFSGDSDKEVKEKMKQRYSELEAAGHELIRRIKIGRNDPCPCGSGKKFKKYHEIN